MTFTVQFYHLTSTPALRAVPKLMEKALVSGNRVAIVLSDDAARRQLSDALWTYNPDGFLPHALAEDENANENPIVLALNETNPNGATIVCMLAGQVVAHTTGVHKVLDIFDGSDSAALAAARERWRHYQSQGVTLQYVKQDAKGAWAVAAQAA